MILKCKMQRYGGSKVSKNTRLGIRKVEFKSQFCD